MVGFAASLNTVVVRNAYIAFKKAKTVKEKESALLQLNKLMARTLIREEGQPNDY